MGCSGAVFYSTILLQGLKRIAFPAISCGVFHYPLDKAAKAGRGIATRLWLLLLLLVLMHDNIPLTVDCYINLQS